MKKSKLLTLIISTAMAFSILAGCGSSGKTESTSVSGSSAVSESLASEAGEGTSLQTESVAGSQASSDNQAVSSASVKAEDEATRMVTDATGRQVEVPVHPRRIAVAAMVLPNMVYALQGTADNIVSMPPASYSGWEMSTLKYLAPELENVDTTMVNDDFSVNVEALAAADVDLVLNWDTQTDQAEQLEAVGIPCFLVTSAKDMDSLKSLVTMLGDALNCQDKAKQATSWYDETMSYFDSKSDQVSALTEDQKPRVLHFQNVNQMTCYTKGINPGITDLEGGQNFTLPEEVTEVTMERILAFDPEIIFISNFDDVTPQDFYENKLEGQDWSQVSAVKNHKVYKVPCGLYRWAPPNAFEKPLYMYWTAQIVQPEIFNDYNISDTIRSFYSDFYGYDRSDEELSALLREDMNR
ncbi:MAG: ABC transporter substrate-binding protein [Lachnospiraceae bacterium]|nr:ABC transporter substrate-binding protein [Lachnospiraceae bacterium]